METEIELIQGLLKKPSEIQSIELNINWLYDEQHKMIVRTLQETRGEISDLPILYEEIINRYPNFALSKADLLRMKLNAVTSAYIDLNAKRIKKTHYQQLLDNVSRQYAENPVDESLREMNVIIEVINSIDVKDDEGNIERAYTEFIDDLENVKETGIKTYIGIDRILGAGLEGGMLVTIGARPGTGKTALGVNMILEAFRKNKDLAVDFFTLEMTQKQMLRRFASRIAEVNSYKLRKPSELSNEEKGKIVVSLSDLLERDLAIYDKAMDIASILSAVKRRHSHLKPNNEHLVMIDYLGLIRASNQRVDKRHQIGEITRELKLLANNLDIPIVLFSQLNRAVENRQDKIPNLSDLRDSGDIEQDSNAVAFLYKKDELEKPNDITLDFQKNRDGDIGAIEFKFIKNRMEFSEVYKL